MDCLILVDIQNDFLPGGALGVKDGAAVIAVANALQRRFECVIATRDWHPADHLSFAYVHHREVGEVIDLEGLEQVLWPKHCVEGTFGAEFPAELHQDRFAKVVDKGIDRQIDSYGAFFDNGRRRATGLEEFLKEKKIEHLYVMGLTTDYCVKFTVLDGLRLGFRVTVIRDGCRPVNLQPDDEQKALDEMAAAGAEVVVMRDLDL